MSKLQKKTDDLSLADVDRALQKSRSLSVNRRRDLRSAVARVATLCGETPERLPLDLATIAGKLATINPIAAGIKSKTLSNVRSDFMTAVQASGLKPVLAKAGLSGPWTDLLAMLSGKRARIGLSRLARFASAAGLTPTEINDAAMDRFIAEVREGSLHQNPNALHRKTATVWNEVATAHPQLELRPVGRPRFRSPPKRVEWASLTEAFRTDVEKYLTWCEGADAFAANARIMPLARGTLKLRRNQIHAAATALLDSGMAPAVLAGLADLVSVDNFRSILRQRHREAGERENAFNRDLAEALVQIAREWVKVDAPALVELKRLTGKMPMPKSGLTSKNKRALRQFDDTTVVYRLLTLPAQLWAEVERDQKPNFRTLATAQAAIAIGLLTYIPLRSQNLHRLSFDEHLFLSDKSRSTSSLEIPGDEVKNNTELAFDIPPDIVKMLIEYRGRIAPEVIGTRPKRVFVRADGAPKSQAMVALLVKTYLYKRAGIVLTAHQFRHLSAKFVLDAEPGSYETVRQVLGHKSQKTTVGSYAGIDSRRAGRHHQRLIEAALTAAPRPGRRRPRRSNRRRDDDGTRS